MKQSPSTLCDAICSKPFPALLLAGALLLGLSACATTTETDTPKVTSIIASAETAQETASEVAATTNDQAESTLPTAAPALSQDELNKQLWDAAQAGDTATVTTLLQQGADVNTANTSGVTALHAAIAAGSFPTVMQLVKKGANVNAATATGWTPLHHAARFGRADAANYLLQQGANPKATTLGTPAKTPVQMALDQGDLRTARILGY